MRAAFLFPLLAVAACSRAEPFSPQGESCRRTVQLEPGTFLEDVEWFDTNSGDEVASIAQWCETVGPAVFDPTPAPSHLAIPSDSSLAAKLLGTAGTPAQEGIDSIAVVTWNNHVGGGDLVRFVRDLRAGRLTKGDSVRHFVLLLQEVQRASDSIPRAVRIGVPSRIAPVHAGRRRIDIVEAAATLGLSLLYVPSMRNGAPANGVIAEDRGNAILSTFPLDDPEAIVLPFERQRRVAATAELSGERTSGDAWKVRVVSTHFDNQSRFEKVAASAGAGRLRQAKALAEELKGQEPLIVAGDFNTWAPAWLERALPFLRGQLEDSPPPVDQHTYVKGRVQRRLDYMFARLPDGWRIRYDRVSSNYASDHWPLLGWLVF